MTTHQYFARRGRKPSDANVCVEVSSCRRVARAKRSSQLFTIIALCAASLCLSNSIYTPRYRSWGYVRGEALHDVRCFHGKKRSNSSVESSDRYCVPRELLQSFGSYPNIFNISTEMRSEFPVMKFPLRKVGECLESASKRRGCWPWHEGYRIKRQSDELIYRSCISSGFKMDEIYDYIVKDFTRNDNHDKAVFLEGGRIVPHLLPTREEAVEFSRIPKLSTQFDVGRYDEDRRGIYTSSLFLQEGTTAESRTVHVGIDIGAPVGTAIFAFEDGTVHAAGYNPDVGDYGHVIVVEHILKSRRRVYALYGHLSAESVKGKYPGQKIRKGQVIGSVGNTAENGGWTGNSSCILCCYYFDGLYVV